MRRFLFAFLVMLATVESAFASEPFEQVRGVIHLDTTVSGGEYTPEEMVRSLRENDLEVAVFTDHATVRWDYGVFPARWIMGWFTGWAIGKAFGRSSSVRSIGPDTYLSHLYQLDRKYDDVIVVPGVEAIPFFYWDGSLIRGTFSLVNGHKHLLAVGMESPEAYERLPLVGEGFGRGYGVETFLSLWPVGLLFLAYRSRKRARSGDWPSLYRVAGLLFGAIGLLFLLNNFPFKFGRYDQYHGDQGLAPYQHFIDTAVGEGGLVFWAHPEIASDQVARAGPLQVAIRTEAYHEDLLRTRGYTGFAAFYAGMKYIIPPGGIWDQVLAQYCSGERDKPVWAIAEGDVEGGQFSPKLSQTVFLLRRRTRQEVVLALKEGRVYCVAGPLADNLSLGDFTLSSDGVTSRVGGTLEATGSEIRVSAEILCRPSPSGNSLKADLIRDGEVIRTFRGKGSLIVDYGDALPGQAGTHTYRLDVRAPKQSRMISNPIFVRTTGS